MGNSINMILIDILNSISEIESFFDSRQNNHLTGREFFSIFA